MVDIVRYVLIGEAVLVVVLVALLVGHGALTQLRATSDRRLSGDARRRLTMAAAGSATVDEAITTVEDLPTRLRLDLLAEFSVNLSGTSLRRVQEIAVHSDVVPHLQELCSSSTWHRRLEGIRLAGILGLGDVLHRPLLDDPHPEVRAEAAYLAAREPTGEAMDRLVRMLDDEAPLCRFAAHDALDQAGGAAADAIARYLSRGGQSVATALEIAAAVARPEFAPLALDLLHDDDPDVRAAAAHLAASVGGEGAAEALVDRLHDDDPEVRRAAARGLGHLEHWPSAPALAELLRDVDWGVRRAAGLALRRLGAVGRMYLRRIAEGDPDPFAADMAQLVISTSRRGVTSGG